MKAVNLIPAEDRRGGTAGGRSGGPAYGVLGALAVLVLMSAAWVTTGNKVTEGRATLASVEQQATAAEAKANGLAAYSAFSDLRKKRAETVASIASSRFDWAHVMHEVSRVIPLGAALTSIAGSVSPDVQPPNGGGAALALRGANPGPALDIVGCSPNQSAVSQMMSRLRLIDGVTRVALADSTKSDSAGGAVAGGASGDDCRATDQAPKFDVLVLFAPTPAAAAAATAAAAVAAGATAPASTTTPAATTPAASTP
jgi:Tfp pilus assembly protein PilN